MTTLYVARRVHTLEPGLDGATGVLVSGGRVLEVGDAAALRSRADETVDFGGATLTPGLVDGHLHPVHGVELTAGVDLSAAKDLDSVRAALARGREELGEGQWLRGWGLNPVVFGSAEPSAAALGPAFAGVPAYAVLYDAHAAIASPEALALAGIDGPREFASSARIACDASGAPTGYLLEMEASGLVEAVIPEESLADLATRLDQTLHRMSRSGLTGGHAMDLHDPAAELYAELERRGDLPILLGCHPMLSPEDPGPEAVLARQQEGGRRWHVEGVKFMVDGTIDGGTAWLEYADTHGQGLESMWRDFDAFREAVTVLHKAGVKCAVHAIGDRGVREVLSIFDDLRATYGPLAQHRIEHIETIPDEVVASFGAGAAAASMQPLHCTFFNNADRSDSWSQRLGDIRVDHGFRWQDIRRAGGVVALGSDWPIAHYDPRWTLADVQLRRHFEEAEALPMQPEQALTALQALEGYTTQAALASGEADHRGKVAPGYDAEFTIFAEDPLTLAPSEVAQVDIVATVVEGMVVA